VWGLILTFGVILVRDGSYKVDIIGGLKISLSGNGDRRADPSLRSYLLKRDC
jgi:hypothetical protein